MKLIKARIRGLGRTMESRWFALTPHLNLFHFPDDRGRAGFFQALETINPPYSCQRTRPFADFPQLISRQGHFRKIIAGKRTVALAVFNSTPDLVADLATISPLLFNTDRIEVGRRLDYSRWINFVELASSSRWSEISADMNRLLDLARNLAPARAATLVEIINPLRPADRIRNGIQKELAGWLEDLPPGLSADWQQQLDQISAAVLRAEHFQTARQIIEARLPLFFVLGGTPWPGAVSRPQRPGQMTDASPLTTLIHLIKDQVSTMARDATDSRLLLEELNNHLARPPFASVAPRLTGSGGALSIVFAPDHRRQSPAVLRSPIAALKTAACLAMAYSRVVCRTEPVLLFEGPERRLAATDQADLADFTIQIAESCQCLYGYQTTDIFRKLPELKRTTAAELASDNDQAGDTS
jgi:hypothetical protein